MPATTLTPDDLAPFTVDNPIDEAKAEAMIEDALAIAAMHAPCIVSDDFAYSAAAKAIIRGALLRWHDSGSGAITQQTAGPFGQTFTPQPRRSLFTGPETEQLQKLCQSADSGGAWNYDTLPAGIPQHADICAVNFGADYCSCGAILTGAEPLWETAGE